MGEAIVVNFFLTVRVLLVGGLLIMFPRIMRKGLLFGVYVGEEMVDTEAYRRLRRAWTLGCLKLMALSLAVGYVISLAGHSVAGNLTGTAVLLLGAFVLYLRIYSRARDLASPDAAHQAATASAPLLGGESKGTGLAKLTVGVCVTVSLVGFVYALISFEGAWTGKPFITVMFLPSVNLVVSPLLAIIALLTAGAKRSIRGGSGGRSIEAQDAFRTTVTRLTSWTALLTCAMSTILSIQIIHLGLSGIRNQGGAFWIPWGLMSAILFTFLFVNLIRIFKKYGQGGALMEDATVETPLTNGLADNSHWVLGLFFVNSDDPSIMVEKRFGLGYALNYGNWRAILFVATFLTLSLTLIALGLLAGSAGGG